MPPSPNACLILQQVAYSGLPLGVGTIVAVLGIQQVPKDFADSPLVPFHILVPSLGNPAASYSVDRSRPKDCLVSSRASFPVVASWFGGLAPYL